MMKRFLGALLIGVCVGSVQGSPEIADALRDAGLPTMAEHDLTVLDVVRGAHSRSWPAAETRRGAHVSRFVVTFEAARDREEWADAVDRLGRMMTLGEEALDADALSEEDADLVAEALVSALPLRAAEGLTLLAASHEFEDRAASARFARLALTTLDGMAAESFDADLVRAHALRLVGEHAEAARAYNAVLVATEGADWADHDAVDRRAAALLGSVQSVAAMRGDTSGLMEGVLGEMPFVAPERSRWEWHLWLEWRQISAGVEYDLARARGVGADEAIGAYEDLLVHVSGPYKAFGGLYHPMTRALALIGVELGGLPAAERMPLLCLHMLAFEAGHPAIGMGSDRFALMRAAWLRADALGPNETPLWSSCAAGFAESVFDYSKVEHPAAWYPEAGDALVRVVEHEGTLVRIASTMRNAIMRDLLDGAQLERALVAIERGRDALSGVQLGWVNTAYMTALERLLARTEPGDDAWMRTIERGEAFYVSEHNMQTVGGLVRLRTTASRRSPLVERAGHAERVVRLIDDVRAAEEGMGSNDPVCEGMPVYTWRLDAADALMVVGDLGRAREMLEHRVMRHPIAEAHERSRVRLLGHLEVLAGNEGAAVSRFRSLLEDPGPELLRGAPFVPNDAGAEELIGTFLADAQEADELDVMEARYASVRVQLIPDLRGFRADPRLHRFAARLIRAGRTDRALRMLALTDGNTPTAGILAGEAYLRADDDASAFNAFRPVAASLEGTQGERSERAYWHAWARMLEILERQNTDGARTDEIDRTVRRLRALPSWGTHADCVEKIEAVASRVSG